MKHFTIEDEITRDELFVMYRGVHTPDNQPVTLRTLSDAFAQDEFLGWRFKHAMEKIATLEHPNILPILGVETHDSQIYVAQKVIDAPTLAEVIAAEGPFTLDRTRYIAEQLAAVLDYVHQKSLTHGDLSADCIHLGAGDRVLVTGFGQAQALFGQNLAKQNYTGIAVETLAPERARGQGPSRPSDLYALGILCYQMLAKQPPFTGPASAVVHAQAYRQPEPLHKVNSSVPKSVSEVIGRMLSKGVDVRYITAAEFARALMMATYTQKETHQYDVLIPLVQRERRPLVTVVGFFYFVMALLAVVFVTTMAVWAGYELGVKQTPRTVQTLPTVAPASTEAVFVFPTATKIPTQTPTPPAVVFYGSPTASPTSTPTVIGRRDSQGDSLRPTLSLSDTLVVLQESVTQAPTLAPPPTATPTIATSQGFLRFTNPTGHDLVVDLTAPDQSTISQLVPPGQSHQFTLAPGSYQAIVHTLTGAHLDTRILYFDIPAGQIIDKDYYSDYGQ